MVRELPIPGLAYTMIVMVSGRPKAAKDVNAPLRRPPITGVNMDLFDLSGRVALVTGSNGGIGLGMAEGVAAAGAAVMIAGRDGAKSEAAVAALRERGGTAEAVTVDVAEETSCRAMVTATIGAFDRLDILINNAGINIGRRPEEMALAEWNNVLATNLTGAFIAAQAAYPNMKLKGGGKIINIGSMFSLFGGPFVPAYSASKGGIVQLTKSLATAWAADNIQVNAVYPAGSIQILPSAHASGDRICMTTWCAVRRPGAGEHHAISPASRSFWQVPPPIL